MPDSGLTNSKIVAAYRDRTPKSAALAERAGQLFPSGITHDGRYQLPYGIYVDHAAGARKWDVDGNEYVDYFGGHGALLLGHNHPEVMAAVHAAIDRGTHFGANHVGEVEWGEAVRRMVPSAERVRFTSSGTEATHMALRLARAFTGRRKVIRLRTHFHGWHDHMTSGMSNHFDGSATVGVLPGVADGVALVDPGDVVQVEAAMAAGDAAAMIFEPTGASFGMVPLPPGYLQAVRDLATSHGVVLIFDEVVTGFRVSPGGAQAEYGVTPDLTTLAKILAGGLPGGALVGRRDILDLLDFEATRAAGREKVQHQGTFNANPGSAAAGVATLRIIETTDACARANDYGAELRAGLNAVFAGAGIPWAAYGTFSGFHVFTNPKRRPLTPASFDPSALSFDELKGFDADLVRKLRLALMVGGVDIQGRPGGVISAAHGADELSRTVAAFRGAIRMLKEDGDL
ncbi:MAG: aspartate aminotransferase family protein [Alphaproteobacteria bacterium]